MRVVKDTAGPILEIGTGVFSTPFLHWSCYDSKRKLVSVESSDQYIEFAKEYESEFHSVVKEVPEGEWDIVFVDSFPIEDRINLVGRLINNSKYVVLHDTEKLENIPETLYRKDFVADGTTTSLLSNFVEL